MLDTMQRMRPVLADLGTRCLWQANGPNGSLLEAQQVGQSIVIFQYFKVGGVNHYPMGDGTGFDAMVTQLHRINAGSV